MGEVGMNNPLVSIILPTYNRANFLHQSIKSVIDQNYKNWELLIIDNNSIDDTDNVVNSFADTRVRLYKIDNQGSIGKSRNLGIKKSLGDWIAFLDSDDYWFSNKLSEIIGTCSTDVDLIFHDLKIAINGNISNFKKVKGWKLKSPVLNDLLIRGNAIANSSVIVRKSLFEKIGGINEDMEINPCVDYHTWLNISTITNSFFYIPKSFGVYCVHSNNASQRDMSFSHQKTIFEFLNVLSRDELALIQKKITFMHVRYKYVNKQYDGITHLLLNCLSMVDLIMTAKSLFMLLALPFNKFKIK